jgi:hypothetical protein
MDFKFTIMKQLKMDQMEKIEGGLPCWATAGLFVVGTAVAVVTTGPGAVAAVGLAVTYVGGMARTLVDCGLI